MIVGWPLVLLVAFAIAYDSHRRFGPEAGIGCHWYWAWALAGAAWSFSLLTGFSIGLVIFPLAVALLLAVAHFSPRLGEATGFLAGIGMTLLAAAGFAYSDPGHGGIAAGDWAVAALVCLAVSVTAYTVVRFTDVAR